MHSPSTYSLVNSPTGDSKQITFTNTQNERKQAIQVFVRLRPFLPSEEQEDIIDIDQTGSKVIIKDNFQSAESTFDQAFDQQATQAQVFEEFKPYMNDILEGYNLTIFAYGQTGSGKTHTMFGSDWESMQNGQSMIVGSPGISKGLHQTTFFESIESDHNYAGIIPRTIYEVFHQIALKREHNPNMQISVYVSFIQIYNEKIFDLLQDNAKPVPLSIHENKEQGTYVEGLAEYQVAHYFDSLQLMKRGEKNRAIRTTSMNAKSSRSHTIFQMQIESIDDGEYAKEKKTIKRSKINLCDLAGSEKINKNEVMGGAHFNELRSINLSLTTLGKVIHSLSSAQKLPVPYRESKLTRILQDSLQGNCQTFIVANIAPCQASIDETYSTLKFAERAQHITLKVKPNEINASDIQVIQKLQREINYLKELLNMKKKGINAFDVHSRLLKLQEENERLKKTHISINEVEKLINENRQMKMEMSKIQTAATPSGAGFGFFDDSKTEPLLRNTGGTEHFELKQNTDLDLRYQRSDVNLIDRSELNSTHTNSRVSHTGSIKISLGMQSTDKSLNGSMLAGKRGNTNAFISTGRLMLKQNEPTTELPMRIRGKNNDFKIEKGFLEVSNAEQIRSEKRKKEKMQILERLGNLDKIQRRNDDILSNQLRKLDQPKEKIEVSQTRIVVPSSLFTTRTQHNSPINRSPLPGTLSKNPSVSKMIKNSENYEMKIKRLEKKFLAKF